MSSSAPSAGTPPEAAGRERVDRAGEGLAGLAFADAFGLDLAAAAAPPLRVARVARGDAFASAAAASAASRPLAPAVERFGRPPSETCARDASEGEAR
jgi:hypothetical protein